MKRGTRLFWIRVVIFSALLNSIGFSWTESGQKKGSIAIQPVKERDLPQTYQDWLKLVSYIILPVEREVFLKLTSERDRDIFMESFWKQRDPTPGTPQNEFKEEHIKRFNYANAFYKRGTPREGWMTDMGRIHIILGSPASIERFEGVAGIHSCQVWFYYGDPLKKLPTYFALVFYMRGGAGEFKLYNPASDGPASLLVDPQGVDVTNGESVYKKIKELAPTLAGVAISMIPGQFPYNFQPSPRNNLILADIFDSPRKNISTSYATHFLDYRGIVSTEYMTNFVESSTRLAVIDEPLLGIHILHFSITPKKASVDFFEPKNQHFCNFRIDVSLKKGETTVFQYAKDFPFYFPPDRRDYIQNNGLSIQDAFPVIEGEYRLTILLQNSVGKEFSIYEADISIPQDTGPPRISGLTTGYKLQSAAGAARVPFQALDQQIFTDPNDTLGLQDQTAFLVGLANIPEKLWKAGEVTATISGSKDKEAVRKSLTIKLASVPFSPRLNLAQALPAREFAPDYYEISLTLKDASGAILDTKTSHFVLSAAEAVPHPVTLAKSFPLSNVFLYYHTLAVQYDRAGDVRKAEENFEKAFALKPDYFGGAADYAGFLVKIQKFDRALDIVERLKGNEKLKFDYFLMRGRALMGKERYLEAIESLREGNNVYNSDIRLLNALGFCFYKTRQRQEALDVLNASLRLNPNQKDVKELLAKIEKDLK